MTAALMNHQHTPSQPEPGNDPYCVTCGKPLGIPLAPLEGQPQQRPVIKLTPWPRP